MACTGHEGLSRFPCRIHWMRKLPCLPALKVNSQILAKALKSLRLAYLRPFTDLFTAGFGEVCHLVLLSDLFFFVCVLREALFSFNSQYRYLLLRFLTREMGLEDSLIYRNVAWHM